MPSRLDVASRLKSPTRHALTLFAEHGGCGLPGTFAARCGVP